MGIEENLGTRQGIFWAWLKQALVKMALAVDTVRDWLVDGAGLSKPLSEIIKMDTLHTLLIGWLFFGILGLFLCKFLFDKYINVSKNVIAEPVEQSPEIQDDVSDIPNKPVRRKAVIIPDECPPSEIAKVPVGTGADPDAVRWANSVFSWIYEGSDAGPVFKENWLQAVNDFTIGSALETGVLVEVVELLPVTPAPKLTNVVVDCSPADNITITCDFCSYLYLRVQTTRTQGEVTTESEYACVVRPLRGRLNVASILQTLTGLIKFDGWPEVSLELEGIRNNTVGLDETALQDVVREVLTSALRNVVLEVCFQGNKSFPRFARAKQVPDPILPVGYDAMVRQTHPPSHKDSKKSLAKHKYFIPHGNEVIEEAGESFTSISYSKTLAAPVDSSFSQVVLTPSEEKLIQNLQNDDRKYSLTDSIDIPTIIAEYNEDGENLSEIPWKNNYIPTQNSFNENDTICDSRAESVRNINDITLDVDETIELDETMEADIEEVVNRNEEPVSGKFVLMVSSRDKPIDEPNYSEDIEPDFIEDDFPEEIPRNNERKTSREMEVEPRPIVIPSHLTTGSSIESTEDAYEDDIAEDLSILKNGQFDFNDKSLGVAVNNNKPLQPVLGVPALQSNSFVTAHQGQNLNQLGIPGLNGKRLLVKIVKANGIGCDTNVRECYAIVEMDEPAQRFNTTVLKDTNAPFWDEQFLFDLSEGTLEILFEIYDKFDNSFHGLGIVGIEELIATPSQRQIIPLQSRPYENDQVSGSLTVEFLFLDRADYPELALRSSAISQSISSKGIVTTTTTTYIKPPDIIKESPLSGEDMVATAALHDIEQRKSSTGPHVANSNTKSTMVIHASRKPEIEEEEDVDEMERTNLASWRPDPLPSVPQIQNTSPSPNTNQPKVQGRPQIQNDNSYNREPETLDEQLTAPDTEERGRSRRKKDSFFGSLKKRFSRSKLRSRSMDPNATEPSIIDSDPNVARSISMERSISAVRSRGLLTVPGAGGDAGSTRSSLSETSGISGSSTRTYINENSTMIVETMENSVIKHYLIPLSLQQKSKWRKKGIKLHVYNEHIFVAKHMSSSTPCQVCQKNLGRRFGKQGYECRDCGFKAHKPCHVKTDTICPNSTINTMDLTMVKDPREEKKLAKLKAANS